MRLTASHSATRLIQGEIDFIRAAEQTGISDPIHHNFYCVIFVVESRGIKGQEAFLAHEAQSTDLSFKKCKNELRVSFLISQIVFLYILDHN